MAFFDGQYSFFGGELQDEIKRLVSDSIRTSSEAFLRSLNLVKTIVTQKPQQKATGMELAERWVRFNLETSNIINRHSQEAIKEILDTLEHYGLMEPKPGKPDSSTQTPATQQRIEINLQGRKGETAQASFIVANPGSAEMETTFAVTEFVNQEGHAVPASGIQFSPAALKLAPNQEAYVQISLKIIQKFRVDKIYIARLRILGHPGREIILKLHVLRAAPKKPDVSQKDKTKQKGR